MDNEHEGNYEWVTGEPSPYYRSQAFGRLRDSGRWDTYDCGTAQYFIVEFE
ncbi:MAG: hypothetical protein P9M15_01640 [Candidatus Electryoneaceae bacterium]|nr:hypothetical protein [Candidatus Electryoneaceae bacterium]